MSNRQAYNRTYYLKTRERYAEKRARSRELNRQKVSQAIKEAKSRPCADCGVQYPHYVMDFDHRGDKKFNIGASRNKGLRQVLAEIAKCDVVCANCHRERTHGRV